MRVARLRKKWGTGATFFKFKASCLYHIATLPDQILDTLTPDTLLTDPETNEQKPLKDMKKLELDRALDALEGRYGVRTPKSMVQRLKAKTKEEFAEQFSRKIEALIQEARLIAKFDGKLRQFSKEKNLNLHEKLRVALLKWPAWATRSKALVNP